MTTATIAQPAEGTLAVPTLAITAAAAVTPAGVGLDVLARAMDEGLSNEGPTDDVGEGPLPPRPVRAVARLPAAELLGRKGLRNIDRTTQLALCAAKVALDSLPEPAGANAGVVVGTTLGSARSSSEYSRQTLRAERPYLVNPSLFPSTVMNCAAGHIAIRHGLHGVNATVAGGPLAGVQAVRYARNALRHGAADRVLVGGAEELSVQSCWGWHRSGVLAADAAVGEGAAVLVLEPEDSAESRGMPVLGRVLAAEIAFAPAGHIAEGLADVIEGALRRGGVPADGVDTVSLGATGQRGLEKAEVRAVRTALGGRTPTQVLRVKRVVGECSGATGVLQIAALLARWRQDATSGGVAVVPALGHDGCVGALVVAPARPAGSSRSVAAS